MTTSLHCFGARREAALSTTEKATLLQGEFGKEGGISFSVLERIKICSPAYKEWEI